MALQELSYSANLIESTCNKLSLDMIMRGQNCDGTGNMAGVCSGAAKIIHSKLPKLFYFHYASHKLNLCVVSSCKIDYCFKL